MATPRTVVQEIATLINARLTCLELEHFDWVERHENRITEIVDGYLPNGSGIDNGSVVDLGVSDGHKIVLLSSYHVMDDNGLYCGWFDFEVVIVPSLAQGFEIDIKVSKEAEKKSPGLTEYLFDSFDNDLSAPITELD